MWNQKPNLYIWEQRLLRSSELWPQRWNWLSRKFRCTINKRNWADRPPSASLEDFKGAGGVGLVWGSGGWGRIIYCRVVECVTETWHHCWNMLACFFCTCIEPERTRFEPISSLQDVFIESLNTSIPFRWYFNQNTLICRAELYLRPDGHQLPFTERVRVSAWKMKPKDHTIHKRVRQRVRILNVHFWRCTSC